MTTTKKRTESVNFIASIITLLSIFLTMLGANIDINSVELATALQSKDMTVLFATIPNLLIPILKIEWRSGFKNIISNMKKSTNFWTQAASVIVLGLGFWNVLSNDIAIAIVTVIQATNIGYHVKKDGV